MTAQLRALQLHLLLHPSDETDWYRLHQLYSQNSYAANDPELEKSSGTTANSQLDSSSIARRKDYKDPSITDCASEAVFRRAKQLVDSEKFEAAINLVELSIDNDCDKAKDPMLAFIRAHAYRKMSRTEQALSILEPFRQEAAIPWIAFELGLIYKELGRGDDAYLCFRHARDIQPDFTWAAIEASRTTQHFNVALGRLDSIIKSINESELIELHLERLLRCGSLLLLIGWCKEALGSGTQARLSDPMASGVNALGSATFYHRPDVCQALGLPEQQNHGFAALLDCSTFRRWSELGHLRLFLVPEAKATCLPTTAIVCLAEVREETNLSEFFEAVMGIFRVSIDSGNRWPDSLRLFNPKTVLEAARLFARHVEEERNNFEIHWLSRTGVESPPLATLVFVQLGSFQSAKPAILQLAKSGLHLEIIIVNNSPEMFAQTFHILDRFAGISDHLSIAILNRSLNLGFSAGCNLGAEYASGRCIIFHNNDLFAESVSDYRLLITRALEDPNSIHTAYQYFTDGTLMQEGLTATRLATAKDIGIPLYNGFSVGRNQNRAEVIACSGSLMAMSTSLFRHLGGFSEEIIYAHFEDFDFCLRARQEGILVRAWKDIRFYHAEGSGSEAPYHLSGTTGHINRLLFSLRWHSALESMDLPLEYSL